MSRDQLIEILRDQLKVQVSTSTDSSFYSKGYDIKVELYLGDDLISTSSDSITMESRDTSEQWRSPFA